MLTLIKLAVAVAIGLAFVHPTSTPKAVAMCKWQSETLDKAIITRHSTKRTKQVYINFSQKRGGVGNLVRFDECVIFAKVCGCELQMLGGRLNRRGWGQRISELPPLNG